MCDSLTRKINELPNEILLVIFSYCHIDSLKNSSLVCKRWNVLIGQSDILWKDLCSSLHESRRLIQIDRELGRSWQETFQMNYKTNETKKKWKKGQFSNPKITKHCHQNLFVKWTVRAGVKYSRWNWIVVDDLYFPVYLKYHLK